MTIQKFFKPLKFEEAFEKKVKSGDSAFYIAGGTEINSNDFKEEKKILISLEKCVSTEINDDTAKNEIVIGANATSQSLIDSEIIPAALKQAVKHITNRNIREMATIGGNIAANKSCSNLIPILCALDAELIVYDKDGEKKISVFKYISEDKKDLILAVIINKNILNRKYNVLKFSRTSNDISIITAAAGISRDSGIVTDARIFLGGVSKHVIRLDAIEKFLIEKKDSDKNEIENEIKKNINPISDIRGSSEFKKHIAAVLICDCIYK